MNCERCGRAYDDAQCWTICPHMPLDGTWRDGHGAPGEHGFDQEKRHALPGTAPAGDCSVTPADNGEQPDPNAPQCSAADPRAASSVFTAPDGFKYNPGRVRGVRPEPGGGKYTGTFD